MNPLEKKVKQLINDYDQICKFNRQSYRDGLVSYNNFEEANEKVFETFSKEIDKAFAYKF